MNAAVKAVSNRAGHQTGYQVYDVETGAVLATFKNRDFGGVAFWQRAKDAAYARAAQLTEG